MKGGAGRFYKHRIGRLMLVQRCDSRTMGKELTTGGAVFLGTLISCLSHHLHLGWFTRLVD